MRYNNELINEILTLVKQNKKYSFISDEIIKKEIFSYLKSNPIKIKEKLKKREIKFIVKNIRAKLHRAYASYQTKKKNKRDVLLNELREIIDESPIRKLESERDGSVRQIKILNVINKLLSTNISTKERANNYQFIYKEIFQITGNPKVVIDLGCGLNPLSFPHLNLKKLTYYAYDIDINDINFLNNYFKIMRRFGLSGKAEFLDIREIININEMDQLPNSDIIFIFKLIDLIDTKSKRKKKISEFLINFLLKNKKTKFVVASFATKTLSQKPMKLPIRKGFELMLLRNNLKFETFSTNNEVFYVVSYK